MMPFLNITSLLIFPKADKKIRRDYLETSSQLEISSQPSLTFTHREDYRGFPIKLK